MKKTLSLFDGADLLQANARRTDPETSHLAAAKVNPSRSHWYVTKAFEGGVHLDGEQVAELVSDYMTPSRARGAIAELLSIGRLRVCGERINVRGNRVRVYEISGSAKDRSASVVKG